MISHVACIVNDIKLKLSYRAGKLFRVEKIRGRLYAEQWQKIGLILPPTEKDIGDFSLRLRGKIKYEYLIQEKSLYSQFVDSWFSFYEEREGCNPIHRAVEGKSMNSIIRSLTGICGGDEPEALATWQAILATWDKMDAFYRNNADLKFINSQLNKILAHAKRLNQKDGTTASAYGARL
ncbi:MAG: hypothetical protein V6Z82_02515 [Flavobacteriales bacterium]